MSKKNSSFTDSDKAMIYVRDRATCCFSGANLWLLDAPLRTGWQSDWADHRKPISRGGNSDWEKNGVCASHTYNMKKRNNSADTTYLFESGHPTALYYDLFSSPPAHVTERLQRLSRLQEYDWYFNRAITWTFEALSFVCWSKYWVELPTRKDDYWLKAAFKKFTEFKSRGGTSKSIENRGLIGSPRCHQQHLLSFFHQNTYDEFRNHALELSAQFNLNSEIWNQYFSPEEDENESTDHDLQRRKTYQCALRMRDQLTDDTFECIQADYFVRYGNT